VRSDDGVVPSEQWPTAGRRMDDSQTFTAKMKGEWFARTTSQQQTLKRMPALGSVLPPPLATNPMATLLPPLPTNYISSVECTVVHVWLSGC
jgi:hypothetical protein